jgi:hypothetical protein
MNFKKVGSGFLILHLEESSRLKYSWFTLLASVSVQNSGFREAKLILCVFETDSWNHEV